MVIDQVNSALLILQRALSARTLYASTHPAVRASEDEAHAQMAPILDQLEEVRVMAVDDRVVWNGETLPATKSFEQELFAVLRRCGADQITFQRGLTHDEVRTLLDVLDDSGPLLRLEDCAHLSFGHIARTDDFDAEEVLGPNVAALRDLHGTIHADRKLDVATLDQVIFSIATVVSEHSGALLPLLDTKKHDEYTFVHTTNVGILSGAMAEALGLGNDAARDVMLAALLHDVGKQAVPEELLNKKERLTDEDVAVLRMHPVNGARMLCNTDGVPELAITVAYEHHIRADGGGYPATPAGWRLNLGSRIVQLADVFDALRTNRPYRAALPVPRIREIMRNDVGTVFDATLLTVFFQQVLNRKVPDLAPASAGA